jgi:hypothetical protein
MYIYILELDEPCIKIKMKKKIICNAGGYYLFVKLIIIIIIIIINKTEYEHKKLKLVYKEMR